MVKKRVPEDNLTFHDGLLSNFDANMYSDFDLKYCAGVG
jgi:hypothetical protein